MRYGFLIDQRRCIGCHACTVACKAEHDVPLGSFRTWVKYTQKGAFPNVTRNFLVERCNHCDDAPCVTICPVEAIWKRDDGIVDFSGDRCIGCKACMAACPYDAIYMDPNTHTLGKCNFCSHRVDMGLQPACVNVCPVEAIVTGDLDDPLSRISQLINLEPASVRRPEKGTQPKLFYLGADEVTLNPEATAEQSQYVMSQVPEDHEPRFTQNTGSAVSGMVQREYSVSHVRPWGWQVSAYLWTKSLAAGLFLVASPFVLRGGVTNDHALLNRFAPLGALFFLLLTLVLLVMDLERPERFLRVIFRPQWRSWLVIGGYILGSYGAVVTLALLADLAGITDVHRALLWPGMLLAVCAAGYTAFLLAQAKGRDMWQSPVLPIHIVTQAVLAGAAALMLAAAIFDRGDARLLATILAVALSTSLVLVLAEINLPHVTAHTRQAFRNMTSGSELKKFWGGFGLMGTILPAALALWVATGGPSIVAIFGGVLALIGLGLYEEMYIRAGQSVPLS